VWQNVRATEKYQIIGFEFARDRIDRPLGFDLVLRIHDDLSDTGHVASLINVDVASLDPPLTIRSDEARDGGFDPRNTVCSVFADQRIFIGNNNLIHRLQPRNSALDRDPRRAVGGNCSSGEIIQSNAKS